jgi:aminopeptidase N
MRKPYLELVLTIHRDGTMPAWTFTKSLFPQFGIDPTFLAKAEAVAAHTVPVVRANLLERADRMRRILRARG